MSEDAESARDPAEAGFRLEEFSRRVGEVFEVRPPGGEGVALSLRLSSVEPHPEGPGRVPGFSLDFAGSLPGQGLYQLRAPDGVVYSLFLVPGGPDWAHVSIC